MAFIEINLKIKIILYVSTANVKPCNPHQICELLSLSPKNQIVYVPMCNMLVVGGEIFTKHGGHDLFCNLWTTSRFHEKQKQIWNIVYHPCVRNILQIMIMVCDHKQTPSQQQVLDKQFCQLCKSNMCHISFTNWYSQCCCQVTTFKTAKYVNETSWGIP